MPKNLSFCGGSRDDLKNFPTDAKYSAGFQLQQLQFGLEPTDWKPMKTVGSGVNEIRIKEESGAFRVFYVVCEDCIYVLHAFRKTTEKTEKRDINLAKARLKDIKR